MFNEDLTPFFDLEGFAVNMSYDNGRVEPASLGSSLSYSGDTLAVGSYKSDADDKGVCIVFVKDGDTYTQQAALQPSDLVAGDHFGWSVSVEGDTLAVGSPDSSSVYIYKRTGSLWSLSQKIEPDDAIGSSRFGYHVKISDTYLLISAPYDNNSQGACYIYYLEAGVWTKVIKFTGSDSIADDFFGYSVDFDYRTAVIGCYNSAGDSKGAVYVFYRVSGVGLESIWSQQTKLQPSELSSGDRFGCALSYYNNTQTLVASAIDYNAFSGAVFIYTRSSGVWTKRKIIESLVPGEFFGWSLSIQNGVFVAGASPYVSNPNVYEYSGSGSSWALSDTFQAATDNVVINTDWDVFVNNQNNELYVYSNNILTQINYISRYGSFKGIFDHDYIAVDNGDIVYEGYKPVITCRTEDIKYIDLDTKVTVEDFEPTLKIVSNKPNGTGVTTLILHKV